MKHLYIIGNGFDIFTGLKTRYSDFKMWLEYSYPFVYENMQEAYEMEGEWWNDFEQQLGKLDVKRYVRKFTSPEPSVEEIVKQIKGKKVLEKKQNLPPNLHRNSFCANRLKGLLDILQYCLEKWIEHVQCVVTELNYVDIEVDNSFFINFNYTDVIEWLYKIPEERVLHIHGRSTKREHLFFGHGNHLFGQGASSVDEEKTLYELNRYEKNPYEHILKYDELTKRMSDVEIVHIYGFSFSTIDEDYIDWIFRVVSKNCRWEVSWYTCEDRKRIQRFFIDHWGLKERLNLTTLETLKINKQDIS